MTIRIAIASDLHTEFDQGLLDQAGVQRHLASDRAEAWVAHLHKRCAVEPSHPRLGPDLHDAVDADLLVLAGDIAVGRKSVNYAADAAAYCHCPMVLVPGNHEFYGHDIAEELPAMRAAAEATNGRVHLLDQDRLDLVLDGRRVAVLGATLWTDYQLNGGEAEAVWAMRDAQMGLNDHVAIRLRGKKFKPFHTMQLHDLARKWFEVEVPRARAESDLVVGVSHHAIIGTEASAPEYRGGRLNPAFASDWRELLQHWSTHDVAPDLWISGHTHHSFDVMAGRTRCVSAQRGYIAAEPGTEGFRPLILQI